VSIKFYRHEAEYMAHELNRRMYDVPAENAVQKLNDCVATFGDGYPWNAATPEGVTLLHTTASYDSVNSVKTLLAMGMDPNTHDEDGNTFVHHAFDLLGIMEYGVHECSMVKWMAENGFDLNVKNKLGQTPLFLLGRHLQTQLDDDYDINLSDQKKERIVNLVEQFEVLGGDFYHKDHEGRTFVDMFPVHPELVEFGVLCEEWKAKIQRHNIEQEVGGLDTKTVMHKKCEKHTKKC